MKLTKTAMTIFMLSYGVAFAGTMGDVAAVPPKFYIGIEGGGSVSTDIHFQPVITYPSSQEFSFTTPVNTDWNRDIGSAGFGGAFAGYEWNQNLALQFSYVYRSSYDWNMLTVEDDANFAPDVYGQYNAGKISVQTFLFDLLLKPSVNWGGFVPYVKGGIGIGLNKIDRLQNINIPFVSPLSYNTIVSGKSSTSFAWDAGVGADYYLTNQFNIGLGYRFVDAGKLRTGSNFIETVSGLASTITPFKAKHVFLNEVSISAAYHFDFV
ncbi:outer membrane protein [Legionella fairfieldensis]|uniref:outer membrane protein n=1 Tax=Legionella fairfieldensis TaxID=45064 RepID=UPI00048BD704|nr:outer membrane beta-barrel protein [Legionella fairfieldensis]